MWAFVKMKTASDKPHLSRLVVDIIVKIRRVRSCRYEHDDQRVGFSAFLVAFPHPLADSSAVGRVAKDSLPPPNFGVGRSQSA